MANTRKSLVADTWTAIAINTTKQVVVPLISTPLKYIYTSVPQGDPAPTDETKALTLPLGEETAISDSNPIDIYVKSKGAAGEIMIHAEIMETVKQDNASSILDSYLSEKLKEDIVLTAPTAPNMSSLPGASDFVLNVDAGHGFTAGGEWLEIWENGRFQQAEVESVATNAITIAMPIERIWTTSAVVRRVNINMNVKGDVTIRKFTFAPLVSNWDITRFILNMNHSTAGTDDLFGSITALTGGVFTRRKNTADSTYGNLFNAKSNADLRERSFDLDYSDKAGPSSFGTSIRRSFNGDDKNGAVVRVEGAILEEIETFVRDDLSIVAMERFRITLQGSAVTG